MAKNIRNKSRKIINTLKLTVGSTKGTLLLRLLIYLRVDIKGMLFIAPNTKKEEEETRGNQLKLKDKTQLVFRT